MRVLIVKLSSLGDLFHALPAVARLAEARSADIDWVTHPAYIDLVRRFAPVRRVIGFPRHGFAMKAPAFLRELRAETYDLAIDMQGLLKSAFVTRAARAKRRIGPSFHREGSHLFYDAVTGPRNKDRHAVEENLDLLDHLGVPRGEVAFPVNWPTPPDLPSGRNIALLPCSRWPTKNWPPEYFAALAKALRNEASLFVFGSPEDAAVGQQIAEAAGGGVVNQCGRTSLAELGGWLAAMDLVITVDSGPMHIAAATGTPVLALFGPTDPRRTGPYGAAHRVLVREGLACRPCLSRTCRLPEADTRCLRGLTPEVVLAAARDMLKAGLS